MLKLIDTHAHLYVHKFDNDRPEMVRRAIATGVERMYLPAIDTETHEALFALEAAFPDNCFAMMGLHPCSVLENFEEELAICERHLAERRFVGIGETGLDLYWPEAKAEFERQKVAFARQIEWGKDMNLPIIIHSRESTRECIELVRSLQDGRARGIFHCFSGSLEEAKAIVDLGFALGIGGTVTYPKSDELREAVRGIGLEHIVLETDAPYLPPVPHRGKRNESAYVRLVAEAISEVKVMPLAEIGRKTTENARRIFS